MNNDRSTPEAAILALESAYNSKNLTAVFELIDFYSEAEIMLKRIMPNMSSNKALISETATALKLSLEKNLFGNGWPEFNNSNVVFEKKIVSKDLYIVSKVLIESEKRIVIEKLNVKQQNDKSYKVAGLVPE